MFVGIEFGIDNFFFFVVLGLFFDFLCYFFLVFFGQRFKNLIFFYFYFVLFIMVVIIIVMVFYMGGIKVGYWFLFLLGFIDKIKFMVVFINLMCMIVLLFDDQFFNEELILVVNFLVIEFLGYGLIFVFKRENFIYWDIVEMVFQVMDVLGVEKVFVLGISQGGWYVCCFMLRREGVNNSLQDGCMYGFVCF